MIEFTTLESGVAACLLDGKTQEETAVAVGWSRCVVEKAEHRLSAKLGARNRVALALKLQAVVFADLALELEAA